MNIAHVKLVIMTQRLKGEWNRQCRHTRQREQEETSRNQAEREKTREDWRGEKTKNVGTVGEREKRKRGYKAC